MNKTLAVAFIASVLAVASFIFAGTELFKTDWFGIALVSGFFFLGTAFRFSIVYHDQRNAKKQPPVLDHNTVYRVLRVWNYSKPVLCVMSCNVVPVHCIELSDQGPPPGFKEALNPERTKLFWVPDKVWESGEYREPVFDSFH